jgi:hypothetical protein
VSYADETITLGVTGDEGINFGRSGQVTRVLQLFTPSGDASSLTAHLGVLAGSGVSADNVVIKVYDVLAGQPTGSLLGSAQLDAGNFDVGDRSDCQSNAVTVKDFPAITGLSLSNGHEYGLVLTRSNSDGSPENVYYACQDTATTPQLEREFMGTFGYDTDGAVLGSLDLVTSGGGGGDSSTTSTSSLSYADTEQTVFHSFLYFLLSCVGIVLVWTFLMR